jgi:hypothetical protein
METTRKVSSLKNLVKPPGNVLTALTRVGTNRSNSAKLSARV